MTKLECCQLGAGDKIVFVYDHLPEILEIQERNGGYLTVIESDGVNVEIEESSIWAPLYEHIELYEEPRPWSYERDY
jgi:NOL1/NOP2/fmu family ribosome biogenesis protein